MTKLTTISVNEITGALQKPHSTVSFFGEKNINTQVRSVWEYPSHDLLNRKSLSWGLWGPDDLWCKTSYLLTKKRLRCIDDESMKSGDIIRSSAPRHSSSCPHSCYKPSEGGRSSASRRLNSNWVSIFFRPAFTRAQQTRFGPLRVRITRKSPFTGWGLGGGGDIQLEWVVIIM